MERRCRVHQVGSHASEPLWLGCVQLWTERAPVPHDGTTTKSDMGGVCVRFDDLKAIGVSRHLEKQRLRTDPLAQGHRPGPLSASTGRIHADRTQDTYKSTALRFAHYARDSHGIRHLDDLDANAPWLVNAYLLARHDAGDSPVTLQTIWSALRMFYRPAYPEEEREERVHALGAGITLPRRRREGITRSRQVVAMNSAIVLTRYQPMIAVCRATGVRRRELAALVADDVRPDQGGGLHVVVRNGKGGRVRTAPVLRGHEEAVLRVTLYCPADELIFPRIPVRLDIHAYRREYAQLLYCEDGMRALPPTEGPLPRGSVDLERALYVGRALGHSRVDVVLRHYLR